ncbi:ImmA/IrrE family metallo-endopeptidase [Paracidovorax citrulli]|uniref:Uncharacterized protein n=2 Tax=Paracidovorax citrulli TaxID=80869 RepID=A1TTK2_PARC0|nr:ImmA/IrrE family metallo-endopeptidase [Paracidovorax citrulli]ABM34290.1 hypothetical protein Aave_3743 [Paracidovorax citrulli AAC00-1]ATG93779.1 ImmA/IrrE family metallo-endopeptidase [Paracidovorax citrulli]MVT28574.1 ImmA/IrrE family metallo-endopeptidase [Paracidovorax citrulli]PVY63736.1 uncharacterized protein DUF955 [Paracidovorax citrulli]REG67299.1 uncharacterized protein DUF955 [Paracidovorax citrulli]
MANNTDRLVHRLLDIGLSQEMIDLSLPDWWVAEDNESPSARAMASMLLARRLNLDPTTLLDDEVPLGFLHTGVSKFKHMRLADGVRRDALVGFATGVGRILLSMAENEPGHVVPANPLELRKALISGRPFVSFGDVIAACWSLGVPVLHLRVFPAQTKGVTAIAVKLGARHAILVARESGFDAQYMFHVAHELGHIALGHLGEGGAIVDADPNDPANKRDELIDDEEEQSADAYAQALLTGAPSFEVFGSEEMRGRQRLGTGRELATRAQQLSGELAVDPGHLVMVFGHSTGDWELAFAAANQLPRQPHKPGSLVNRVMWSQLGELQADEHSIAFLQAVAPI